MMVELVSTIRGWLITSKDKKLKETDNAIQSNLTEIANLNKRIDAIHATLNGENEWFLEQDREG